MPEILKEGTYVGDIVKYEAPRNYSRKIVTIPSGKGVLKAGTVLEVTSSGYQPLSYTAAVTGGDAKPAATGTPAAILLEDVDATSAAVNAVALARHSMVVKQKLLFSFTDTTVLPAVYDDLESLGIIVVEGE